MHTAGEGLGHLVSGVDGHPMAKKALSRCARLKLKQGHERQELGGIQQTGNAGKSKQGETLTETLKRPRSEGRTTTETARAPKKLRDSMEAGTYKVALTNIKIAIFRETYPEVKLTEDDQNCILEVLRRVLHWTPMGELPHLK
jgi:hypothetical protein